jgi:signal transduction histidine kinase
VNSQANGGDPSVILANRLELVERAADDLAHEIKNPLHSMVINLEVLRRRIGRLEEPAQADVIRYVEVLGGELDRLTQRVDVLLRLLRPGRADEPVPINELVEELWEIVQVEAGKRSVTVGFTPHAGIGNGRVPRDPVRQVILNLLLDLLDFLRPGDRLEVRAELLDDEVKLLVSAAPNPELAATGSGTAPLDDRARIRVARSLSEHIGGRIEAAYDGDRPALLLALPRMA